MNRFETPCLMSWNNCGAMSTDLHQRAAGIQPLPHFIYTCPQCGYTADSNGFDLRKIDKKLQQLIKENLRSFAKDERIPGYVKYDFAARIATWKNECDFAIGDLYLKAAWSCNDCRERKKEKFYRCKAVEYFEKAIEAEEVSGQELILCCYLIAENNRRNGKTEIARQWFDRTISLAEPTSMREFIELAIQQRDFPKEYITKN